MEQDEDLDYRRAARLWVSQPLALESQLALNADQAHYLRTVLRQGVGDELLLFNGQDGEWLARIAAITKSTVSVVPVRQTRAQPQEIDLHLLFAPIKRARIDMMIEKAVELGASALIPVITRRTIVSRLNLDRLNAHAREAAEQAERLSVPPVSEPRALEAVLRDWDNTRRLLLCDETGSAPSLGAVLQGIEPHAQSWAVLIGPEGGFEPSELDLLRGVPFVTPVSLGPRVLRADTAALAALAVFQALRGDWDTRRVIPGSSSAPITPPLR